MSDDQPLGDTQPQTTVFGNPNGTPHGHRDQRLETLLDLDEVMSSARLVERVSRICMRGDILADLNAKVEELGDLVDSDGTLLEDDDSLGAGARVGQLQEEIVALKAEAEKSMRVIRFRGMDDAAWATFDEPARNKDRSLKHPETYYDELIARCAIAPTLTVAQVKQLRTKLGPVQMTKMANDAYFACTTGGLDVPKLPDFWRPQKPDRS